MYYRHNSRSCFFDESQDECEERDSIQEAHETKKACDRKHYKADFESKKDSTKAQYWLDPERKKEREGLLRSKSRTDFSLQTSSISGKSKGLEKKSYEVGVYLLGAISKFIRAQGNGISFACVLASRLRFTMLFASPPPPPPQDILHKISFTNACPLVVPTYLTRANQLGAACSFKLHW